MGERQVGMLTIYGQGLLDIVTQLVTGVSDSSR